MADERRRHDDIDLVDLYITYNPNEAEFIKDMLEDNEITCFLRDLHPAQFPMNVGKHGQVRVQVENDRAEDAADLIRAAIAEDAITDEGSFVSED